MLSGEERDKRHLPLSPGERLEGTVGGISVILVKNHFFILLNKFGEHTITYDSLKFQTSITVLQSFIRTYVNLCAI